jgi:hypothetical protein
MLRRAVGPIGASVSGVQGCTTDTEQLHAITLSYCD